MRPVGLSQIKDFRVGWQPLLGLGLTYDATMPGTLRSLK